MRPGGSQLGFSAYALISALIVLCVLQDADAGDGEISRRVLGLYNSKITEWNEPANCAVQEFLAMPLNYLGFAVDYHDVNQPLPDASRYHGIVVWLYSYEIDTAERLLPWLLEAMRAGVKVMLPDGLQAPYRPGEPPVGQAELAEILGRFGLEPIPQAISRDASDLRVRILRPEYFSFETSLMRKNLTGQFFRDADPGTEVWARLEQADNHDLYAVIAAAGEAGFWSMSIDWFLYYMAVSGEYRVAWNINPFAMLEAGLNSLAMPKPDVSTFWGARGAYSHVDVDGPYNLTQYDVPGPQRTTLEVMRDEVWKKYPYPVTLGWIASDYNPDIDLRFILPGETPEQTLARDRLDWERPHAEIAAMLRKLAMDISRLPNIQSGCHSFSHPLDWRNLRPGYAIRDYAPNYEMEVRGAVEYLDKYVLPPDKPVELYQWAGDCDPPAEALDILAEMGLPNINGGDSRYDQHNDSVYYISPLSRPKGKHLQIHTSGTNENIYTENWGGFKGAFKNVITAFERSDQPKRFLPVNIYYHVFPAEHLAGYKAIQHVYDWAAGQELCWMTAREYVRAAESFFRVRVGRNIDGGWWIEDYGSCSTIRFDDESRRVDLTASKNVAGYRRHNKSLYVALIPGDRAEIRLGDREDDSPCLAGSSGMLRNIERRNTSWKAEIRVWGQGFVDLWAPEGEWRVEAGYPGGKTVRGKAERFDDGRIRFPLSDAAGQWVGVHFEK
ncbi:MAG: hypothetical protein FWG74_02935 [Planctomycetes bacterium]|nr:hypothetical protein [Planctomycetota bacterium]